MKDIHKIEQTTIDDDDFDDKTKEEEKSILVESKIDDGKLLIDWWHLFGRVLLLKLINNIKLKNYMKIIKQIFHHVIFKIAWKCILEERFFKKKQKNVKTELKNYMRITTKE